MQIRTGYYWGSASLRNNRMIELIFLKLTLKGMVVSDYFKDMK